MTESDEHYAWGNQYTCSATNVMSSLWVYVGFEQLPRNNLNQPYVSIVQPQTSHSCEHAYGLRST
jgi:hypothetical protein